MLLRSHFKICDGNAFTSLQPRARFEIAKVINARFSDSIEVSGFYEVGSKLSKDVLGCEALFNLKDPNTFPVKCNICILGIVSIRKSTQELVVTEYEP